MNFPAILAIAIWHPCATDMIHVANVLYLCSYLVRDILWLRVLSVVAGLSLMPYYCSCGDHTLWAPITWNALFAFVNIVQIAILVSERWPRQLPPAERKLREEVFPELSAGEFLKLLKRGEWRDVAAGDVLVRKGTSVADMMILTQGAMAVRVDDHVIATLEPGQFIGEMSFLSGNLASADVVATEASRVLAWPQDTLARHLDANTSLSSKLRAVLGLDVVAKLRAHGKPDA